MLVAMMSSKLLMVVIEGMVMLTLGEMLVMEVVEVTMIVTMMVAVLVIVSLAMIIMVTVGSSVGNGPNGDDTEGDNYASSVGNVVMG